MLEFVVLLTFTLLLIGGIVANIALLPILSVGLVLFSGYALYKTRSVKSLIDMFEQGISGTKNILVLLFIIGMITAMWRASGTIASIVSYASLVVIPEFFVLIEFLFCAAMGMILGSALGTAATMGVICASIAQALGINPAISGGAILAGAFFGDRSSPVSSSAALVATLTNTNIFNNMKRGLKLGIVPFFVTCFVYAMVGFLSQAGSDVPEMLSLFSTEFSLSLITLLPAVLVIILSLFRVDVKKTMLISLVAAVGVYLFIQQGSVASLPSILLFGFASSNNEVASIINGGGILSMLNIIAVIMLVSCYAGIFEETGLLSNLQQYIEKIVHHTTPFTGVLLTSIFTSAVACNQTFAIMLTSQLCKNAQKESKALALQMQSSVVVLASLVPWSISSIAALSFIGAPTQSLLCAVFLYLLPLWTLVLSLIGEIGRAHV